LSPPATKSHVDGLNVNAGTLDGLDSSQFLRSDTSDITTGTLTVNTATNTLPLVIARNGSASEALKIGINDGSAVFKHIQDEAYNGVYQFYVQNDQKLAIDHSGINISGSVKVADDTRLAPAAGAGTIRWNSGKLQNSDGSEWKDVSYTPLGSNSGTPGTTCLAILDAGDANGDGIYWIRPGASAAFEAYCYMGGDWPGATLVQSFAGSRSGSENRTAAIGDPIPQPNHSYSSFADTRINEIKATSPNTNGYIARCHKGGGWVGAGSYCVGFIRTSCTYSGSGTPPVGCENSWISQSSTSYCTRDQHHDSYRGFEGHNCSNSNGSSWGSYSHVDNQFMIWEHAGGTTYCGGWDTEWNSCELLIR